MYGRKSRGSIFFNPDASMSSCPEVPSEIIIQLSDNKNAVDIGSIKKT
jgi:hypothetical protein